MLDAGDELNQLTEAIIGAAIEVHRALGPGLLERTYDHALRIELRGRHLSATAQAPYRVLYKGEVIDEYIPDLIVEGRVVVELKAVERLLPLHEAQMLAYLRVTGCKVGLLINFNVPKVRDGLKRMVLTDR